MDLIPGEVYVLAADELGVLLHRKQWAELVSRGQLVPHAGQRSANLPSCHQHFETNAQLLETVESS